MASIVRLPAAPTVASELISSWQRHLRAANKSPRTIDSCSESALGFVRYLEHEGDPTDLAAVQQRHVERFIAHQLATHKPATASIRFRSLQQLFKWMADEGEIAQSPMAKMRPPRAPEQPGPVLREDDLRRLLKTCEGDIDLKGAATPRCCAPSWTQADGYRKSRACGL